MYNQYKIKRTTAIVVLALLSAIQVPVLKDLVVGLLNYKLFDLISIGTIAGILGLWAAYMMFQREI